MLQFADQRSYSSSEDRVQPCSFCGKEVVTLPNDRRGGACFDCLALLGAETVPCAECGAPAATGAIGGLCSRCHWSDRRS